MRIAYCLLAADAFLPHRQQRPTRAKGTVREEVVAIFR
jgi:hypothetical protein